MPDRQIPVHPIPAGSAPEQTENTITAPTQPIDWQRLEALFHRASELPPTEREARAREWCAGDPVLLAELLGMLASDSSVESLLASSTPVKAGDGFLRTPIPANEDSLEETDPWLGRELGPFRLERMLGRGGMGVVYLGRRISGGFAQTVAVKLVGRHMRSAPALHHFLMERDALARLEHRNIARILDGGVTPEGIPYVVMEYIEGRLLHEVCDDPATSTEATLGLMLQLCDAVAYVHRNLILHRDLKPGNVLVTNDGIVKLLDFGTLKLIGPTAAPSEMTQAGLRPVTLRYASPEHIKGQLVSTATDVYSLGMILYRLLAHRLPEFLDATSVDQLLHRLQSAPLEPPSTLAGSAARTGKAHRRMFRDLDAIVMKAIRFEPDMRYSSAGALADDIAFCLAGRPVSARRDTRLYRLAKFYQRNPGPVLATAAVLLVLSIGLGIMRHESHLARMETLRAEQGVADEQHLAHLLLFDFFEQLKQIPGSTDAQRRTVSEALQYLDHLTGSKAITGTGADADNVEAYTELGQLLGSPYEENLGDAPGAIRTLQKAVDLAHRMVARDPHNLVLQQDLAAAELALGRIYFGSGDPKQALVYLKPAADTSSLIAHDPTASTAMLAQAASVWDGLGDLYGLDGAVTLNDPHKAIDAYRQADLYDKYGVVLDPACARCRRGVAVELWKLGLQLETSAPAQAVADYTEGLQALAQFSPEDQHSTRVLRLDTLLRDRLGVMDIRIGRPTEGLQALQQVQARFREAIARDPIDSRALFDLAALDPDLADAYQAQGNNRMALETDLEYITNMNSLLKRDPDNVQWQHHKAEATLRYEQMLHRMPSRTPPPDTPSAP